MMADEPEDDEDDQDLLNAFAKAGLNAPPPATIPAGELMGPPGAGEGIRVVGAQQVAVKRKESDILKKLKVLAAAAGEAWYYRWPVKNKKTGATEYIEGPSIKLANELARLYGNCEVDSRVVDLGESWLIYARFTDYETGYSLTRPFQQRKRQRVFGDKATAEDVDRARDVVFQIGVSKAIRNVVVKALQTFADYAFKHAKGALVGKIGKNLPSWRDKTIERLSANVDIRRVEAVLGRSAQEWLAPDVAQAIAMMKAVTDGMTLLDEQFPPLSPAPGEAPADKLDEFAKTDSGAPAQPATDISSAAAAPGPRAPDTAAENADNAISPPAKGVSAAEPSSTLDFGDAP
jgi:hypothetical protein